MLDHCQGLLKPKGYILIKDIASTGGYACRFMDKYVVCSYPIYLRDADKIDELLPANCDVIERTKKYRFPFPNYYVKVQPRSGGDDALSA